MFILMDLSTIYKNKLNNFAGLNYCYLHASLFTKVTHISASCATSDPLITNPKFGFLILQ